MNETDEEIVRRVVKEVREMMPPAVAEDWLEKRKTYVAQERFSELDEMWQQMKGNILRVEKKRKKEETTNAILQKIVDEEFFSLIEGHHVDYDQKCVVCGGALYMAWDEDAGGNRFADIEFCTIDHTPDCFVGMAHALVKGTKE